MTEQKKVWITRIVAIVLFIIIAILFGPLDFGKYLLKETKQSDSAAKKYEITTIVKSIHAAYHDKVDYIDNPLEDKVNIKLVDARENTSSEEKQYKYLCISVEDLAKEGYIASVLADTYSGYIELWVPSNGNNITNMVITDGISVTQGRYNGNFSFITVNNVDKNGSLFKCPESEEKVIPNGTTQELIDKLK